MLEVTTLGGLSITRRGEVLTQPASRKAKALLVYLACIGRPLARQVAAELLWPESRPERARRYLGRAITSLRQLLGDDLTVTAETLALNPAAAVWLDVRAMEERLRAGQTLPALDLYRGAFLEGFSTRGMPALQQWAMRERLRLRRAVVDALQTQLAEHLVTGQLGMAISHATRLLDLEPAVEPLSWHFRLLDRARTALVLKRGRALGSGTYYDLADDELYLDDSPSDSLEAFLGRQDVWAPAADPERILAGIRLVRGPSLADRVISLDAALVALMGAIGTRVAETGDTLYIGVLVVIAIVAFTATVALSRFIETTGRP